MTDARDRCLAMHRDRVGSPTAIARAPGRVNLIGEHTDYNDGFVMPMALPFDTAVCASPRSGGVVEIHSEGFGTVVFKAADPLAATDDWAIHIRGVHHLLAESGVMVPGWSGTISTDIPTGASLSSSAALEVAVALICLHLAGAEMSMSEIARLGQRVENEVLGLPSGIMDQLISATAVEGHASLIDCRALASSPVRLPWKTKVVVMDTMSRRELVDSEYAARRASCAKAAKTLGLASLREATLADVARLPADPPELKARAGHVVTENARVIEAAAAMEMSDGPALGQMMNHSHRSLRDDYEVSGPELDLIVNIAQGTDGCHGARMTGGGFAGCAVALVDEAAVPEFVRWVSSDFAAATGVDPAMWVCAPAPGASVEAA